MVASSDVFEVFTHLDVAIRYWSTADAGPFDPRPFEELIRAAMRSIADSGRALSEHPPAGAMDAAVVATRRRAIGD